MKHRIRGVRWLALAALVAGVVLVPSALAVDGQGRAESRGSGLWFVELQGAPAAAGGSVATNRAQKAAFRTEAAKARVSFTQRYAFDTLWNGLSIRTGADAAALRSVKGVKAVYPVLTASIPPMETISPDLETALTMTGADIVHSNLGFDGTGVRVAVMDTGLDLDHPDLGGDGTQGAPYTNSRVVSQWDFVGDAYNADPGSGGYSPVPVPDPIADDCNSHGTHVSGIVGANGIVTGVAPGVTFGAYRVFGCAGSTEGDIMIAAMERALADDMDVLNMSIGSAFNTWPQYPTAAASDLLVQQGMVVVASIGNSGANGVYSAGAPGVGKDVIGTASFDNTFVNLANVTVSPAGLDVGYANAAAAPPAPLSGSLPLAKANAIGAVPPGTLPADDGCAATPPGTYTGMIVIIRRGTCGFYQKARLAQLGGASAVALYNNCPPNCGRFSPTVAVGVGADGLPVTIPVVAISDTEGVAIHNAIVSGAQTWNWTSGTFTAPNPTGGTISSFSSFGLGAELDLKPDIGAPGGLIRSTYPIELGSYSTISGTSMASPHVAGAVALLLDAHPNVPASEVRSRLQNSADPKTRFGQTYLDNVHRQGAGMLDIDDAILAATLIQPGKISLGDGNGGTAQLQLRNSSGSPVTYQVSHEPASGTTGTFAPVYSTAYSSVSFSSDTVTVPANGTATVSVTVTPSPSLPAKGVYGGYIKFTPQEGGHEYRVPYAGFNGDYQSVQVLTPTASSPSLGRLGLCPFQGLGILRGSECFGGGGYFTQLPAGEVFTFVPGLMQTPHFILHLDHQARSLKADIYKASNNTLVGTGLSDEYLGRSSGATSFFAFLWDGKVKKGPGTPGTEGSVGVNVPDGTYYAKITVAKALGTPAQVETWTSPNFVIDRP